MSEFVHIWDACCNDTMVEIKLASMNILTLKTVSLRLSMRIWTHHDDESPTTAARTQSCQMTALQMGPAYSQGLQVQFQRAFGTSGGYALCATGCDKK